MPKDLTRAQLQSRKERAVRFVRDVLDDRERADEIEAESLEDYAQRRRIQLLNPQRRKAKMARRNPSVDDLTDRIRALKSENQDLQDQLDAIADILSPDDDDSDDDDSDDDDSD